MRFHQLATTWPVTLFLVITTMAVSQSRTKADAGSAYEIVELPLRPSSISNSGWVAGSTEDQHAATWNAKAGLFRISLPAEFSFSESTSINNNGDAVGTAATADSSKRIAFIVRENKVSLLPGNQSRANSINDSGGIVGQTIFPDSKAAEPVLWKNGASTNLHICCAGWARSINRQNLIVGDTYDPNGRYHAFLWDAKTGKRLLETPGEEFSSALALNDRGEVLIKGTPGGLFLYSNRRFQPIDIPKATPHAMNHDAFVVGSYGPKPEEQRAFVWDKLHGMRDLNSLIPKGSGWTLEVASGINDKGEIVGWGDRGQVENAGFLLRPRVSHARRTSDSGSGFR